MGLRRVSKLAQDEIFFRIVHARDFFRIQYSLNGEEWSDMRITHLLKGGEEESGGKKLKYDVGVYSASPTGGDFLCVFDQLQITTAKQEDLSH